MTVNATSLYYHPFRFKISKKVFVILYHEKNKILRKYSTGKLALKMRSITLTGLPQNVFQIFLNSLQAMLLVRILFHLVKMC